MRKAIEIKSLSIGYKAGNKEKVVAAGINAAINRGELTCLLGANGIGKSTLLRTLSAFIPKLGGEIWIQGKEIGSYAARELSRVIAVVLTDRVDIPNMTSEELIGLGRSPYTGFWGTLDRDDKQKVSRVLKQIHIEDLAQRTIQTLSDGERQKVMIAKALAQETPVVFLDEPTAFLDFPSKVEIMLLLRNLSRGMDKTIFLSTHDLELALQIADKLWIMDNHHNLIAGTPEDLSLNGVLADSFAHKGIFFEPETGSFRIKSNPAGAIRLRGSGPQYAIVRKALARYNILAGEDADSDLLIEINTSGEGESYLVYSGNELLARVGNVEELLEAVRKSSLSHSF